MGVERRIVHLSDCEVEIEVALPRKPGSPAMIALVAYDRTNSGLLIDTEVAVSILLEAMKQYARDHHGIIDTASMKKPGEN